METQRCGRCKVDKPSTEFAPAHRGRAGFWCRACKRAAYTPRPIVRPAVPDGHDYCTSCQEAKPHAEFYRKPDGTKNGPCKACRTSDYLSKRPAKPGASTDPRPCKFCGVEFRPKNRRVALFCSRRCGQMERTQSGRERNTTLLRKYGMTQADYERLLSEQGGGCAICQVKPDELTTGRYRTYLHVDHCHDSGRVRGLLCPDCNLKIGRWDHDPALLRRAADYLER